MRKLGLDLGIGAIVRSWTQLTAFLVIVVAGRMLGREEFGVFSIASVFVVILSTLMYSGLYEYIIKAEDYEAVADTCFWLNFGFALCGALAMAFLAPLVGLIVGAPDVTAVMWWLAPTVVFSAVTSWQEALVLRQKKVTTYYAMWFVSETASSVLAIGLLFWGSGVYALVGYRYGALVVSTILYLSYAGRFPGLNWHAREARVALAFASGLYGSRVVNIVANFGADLIIGILASPAAAGSYRLASRMVFGFSEIWFQPVKTIAWVRFSSATRDRLGLDREWLGLMMVLSMIAWPMLGGVAVLSEQLTVTVLGSNWAAAGSIVCILALAKSGELFEIFLDPLLGTAGASQRLFHIRVVACLIAMAGFFALARFGAPAAALAQVGTYLMLAIVTIGVGLERTGLAARSLLPTLLPGAATTLLTVASAAAAVRLESQSGWPPIAQFACEIAAGALAWAFAVGVVFRRRVWGMMMTLKHQKTAPAAP